MRYVQRWIGEDLLILDAYYCYWEIHRFQQRGRYTREMVERDAGELIARWDAEDAE